MNRYLLDTQAAVWLLVNSDDFPAYLREELQYAESQFHLSYLSIVEMIHLRQCKKIDIPEDGKKMISDIVKRNITLVPLDNKALVTLSELPLDRSFHSDPFDRAIISTAICRKFSLISSDKKFPAYRQFGLDLIEI